MYDGIQRVLFGNGISYWLHKLLLLDSISFLSHGKISLPLQRYVLIDIDDIFVGEKGTRMKRSDVFELLESQQRLSQLIPGFRFNLGFSGKYYHKGYADEDYGDDLLIGILFNMKIFMLNLISFIKKMPTNFGGFVTCFLILSHICTKISVS